MNIHVNIGKAKAAASSGRSAKVAAVLVRIEALAIDREGPTELEWDANGLPI